MRIVLFVDWHSEKMGYSDNFLPRALASLGHEVHLVSSNGQVYFTSPAYKHVFEPFLGPPVVDCGVEKRDGYTLHRLESVDIGGRVFIKGLVKKLRSIRPHIVQAGEFICLTTYELALLKPVFGYKFFVECHVHASVFPAAGRKAGIRGRIYWPVYAATIGSLVSCMSERCYPISSDAADIAAEFFGVRKKKIAIRPLGVDTDLFRPVSGESSMHMRIKTRRELGFLDSDIVCVYTGRFDSGKNPLCLARAVKELRAMGEPFRGLFIGGGNGLDRDAAGDSVVHSFVPVKELPRFYQAGDIAVWPRQESTSQLDAAACGLPLILSDKVKVRERVEGNGLVYKEDDVGDMIRQLRVLRDPAVRKRMGACGADKMRRLFSWRDIARKNVMDYEEAMRG